MGLLLSVQQWMTQLQTGQQEIELPLELFPLNFVSPFHVCALVQTTFEIQHHILTQVMYGQADQWWWSCHWHTSYYEK